MTRITQERFFRESATLSISFFLFSELWDLFIYFTFSKEVHEVTFLAASILNPEGIWKEGAKMAAYVVTIGLAAIFISWLMRKMSSIFCDSRLWEQSNFFPWVLLGLVFSLTEFEEISGAIISLIILILLFLWWWVFARRLK